MTPGAEAWHEAGHAVAAHLMGGVVREVSVESDLDGASGHTAVRWGAARADEHARRLAAVALAGPVAELVFLGDDRPDDASVLAAWRGDWDTAEQLLGEMHAHPDARDRERRSLIGELWALFEMPTHDEALARVADALDAHGTLDEHLFAEALAQD